MAINNIVTDAGRFSYDRFHFSEAVESDGHIFCSGVIGSGEKGKIPEDISEEFRNAWAGVGRVLEAAGAGFDDIVEYTSYHIGMSEHMAEFMAVRDEVLSEPWPAWTAIGTTELAMPGAHVEIRVTAKLK